MDRMPTWAWWVIAFLLAVFWKAYPMSQGNLSKLRIRCLAAAGLLVISAFSVRADQPDPPPFVQRAQPGPGQAALQPLVGKWKVEKSLYVAVGTPEHPAKGESMVTERVWIANGRFLQDVTRGTIGGQSYFRTGFLGYNNMDRCYEWVTADGFTPTMMIYRGTPGAGPIFPATLQGSFTDLGVTGEKNVGKLVRMRTVIRIEGDDRHVFEIYFTAPNAKEVLADRMIYTRLRE